MKFLTEPWARAVTGALAASPATREATRGRDVLMLLRITACPPALGSDELSYLIRAVDGVVTVELGSPPEPPDLASTMTYATAVALSRGTLDPRAAALGRRIESTVGIMTIMRYAPVLDARLRAEQSLTGVEY